MLDETMLEDRLRAAGTRAVDAARVSAPRVMEMETRVREHGDRRSLRVGAAAMAVAVGVGAVALVTRDPRRGGVQVHTTAPAAPALDRDGLPLSLPGISAEQMQAHVGVGAPKDWLPVEFGAARLFMQRGSCGGSGSAFGDTNGWNWSWQCPSQAVTKVTISRFNPRSVGPNTAPSVQHVHGYEVDDYGNVSGAIDVVVPALGVRIGIAGPGATTILTTIAPSFRAVVEARGAVSVPVGWQTVTVGHLRFSVPRDWPVDHRGFTSCVEGGVHIGTPQSGHTCTAQTPRPSGAVRVDLGTRSSGAPVTTVHDESIMIATRDAAIEIFAFTDARIARAIQASVRAT